MTPLLEQTISDGCARHRRVLRLPPPTAEVLPGVLWGRPEILFTPAFWAVTMWLEGGQAKSRKDLGARCDLKQEVMACLLGGYGITFELNRAAFTALLTNGLFDGESPDEARLAHALSRPLVLPDGRRVRYRFPRQKARFLAAALAKFRDEKPSPVAEPLALRRWLLTFPGIGLKTASWIVRNHCDSDEVAIIDIHILRAGLIIGLFRHDQTPSRNYLEMESRFLEFARRLSVEASRLDLVMWEKMRESGRVGVAAVARGPRFSLSD